MISIFNSSKSAQLLFSVSGMLAACAIVSMSAGPSFAQAPASPSSAVSPTADFTGGQPSLSPSAVISDGVATSDYVLGTGDTLNIVVVPQTAYGLSQVSIDQSGVFEYPRLGDIQASGKTVTQLRDEIAADLQKYCVNPNVSVQVTALRPQVVYVTGGVKTPKILDVRSAPNVAKAITLADGANDINELSRVAVFRNGSATPIPSNVYGLLVNGVDTGQNTVLQPGDLVVVPVNTAKFAVVGAVNSPGLFPLTPDGGNEGPTHLADALVAAGGVQHSGAAVHGVEIIHVKPDGSSTTTKYDYGKYVKSADISQNPVISDRDLIFVPDSKHATNAGDALGYLSYYAILKGL